MSCIPAPQARPGFLDLASNDYLGLSANPEVVEAAVAAARQWGTGSGGSRLVTGSTGLHDALERALAAFGGAQAALVFSSGYLANLAAITAAFGRLAAAGLAPPLGGRFDPAVFVRNNTLVKELT